MIKTNVLPLLYGQSSYTKQDLSSFGWFGGFVLFVCFCSGAKSKYVCSWFYILCPESAEPRLRVKSWISDQLFHIIKLVLYIN